MINDYKNLKLKASSNPHIRNHEDTRSLMLDVIIALMPALAMSVYMFGIRSLAAAVISVAGAVFFEWLYRKLLSKPQTVGDLSAALTGLLLAMTCSSLLPYWMLLVGDFFAIFVVKQLYGGIGKNFLNPALAGRAALVACYAGNMGQWAAVGYKAPLSLSGVNLDAVTAATPMALMKGEGLASVAEQFTVGDMFIGFVGGAAGEVSAIMLLFGGLYLIFRKVISWQIPVAYIGTVAALTFLFPQGNDALQYMLYNVFGGGLFLGAFFMATDYVTSPVTRRGQLVFGLGCGVLTVFIRCFGSYPEGVCYSILIMNCTTWIIDKAIKPSRFGVDKNAKKEAAKP